MKNSEYFVLDNVIDINYRYSNIFVRTLLDKRPIGHHHHFNINIFIREPAVLIDIWTRHTVKFHYKDPFLWPDIRTAHNFFLVPMCFFFNSMVACPNSKTTPLIGIKTTISVPIVFYCTELCPGSKGSPEYRLFT